MTIFKKWELIDKTCTGQLPASVEINLCFYLVIIDTQEWVVVIDPSPQQAVKQQTKATNYSCTFVKDLH